MPSSRGLLHPRTGRAHDLQRLGVGDLAGRAPRVDRGGEAALALPQVADPGDRALVEQRVADRARRVVLAQAAQEALLVELGREDVGSELGEPAVEARARLGQQLEHRAVELHDLAALGAQDEPGAARRRGASAGRRGRCPRSRSCAGASGSSGRLRSAGRGACRGRRRSRTLRPASFCGQRSPRRRGLGCEISGTSPSTSGRMRRAA